MKAFRGFLVQALVSGTLLAQALSRWGSGLGTLVAAQEPEQRPKVA
jgi:hypothetical protein